MKDKDTAWGIIIWVVCFLILILVVSKSMNKGEAESCKTYNGYTCAD